MVTYLIRETRPDVNGSRLAVGGGINRGADANPSIPCYFCLDILPSLYLLITRAIMDPLIRFLVNSYQFNHYVVAGGNVQQLLALIYRLIPYYSFIGKNGNDGENHFINNINVNCMDHK